MNVPFFQNLTLPVTCKPTIYLVILSLAILPFLILAGYCQPFADDFWLTNIAIENGPWQAQQIIRQTWSGRYFAMLLGSVNPLVYQSFVGYKLLPVLLMFSTLAALYAFVSRLGPGIASKQRLLYTLLLQVLYLGFMPAIASGYFWMSSALNYQTALIILLLLATLWWSYRKKRSLLKKAGYTFLISGLIFAGVGCNELSMVLILEATIIMLGIDFRRSKQVNGMLLWFVLVALASTVLAVSSPGNLVRLQTHANHSNFIYSGAYAMAVTVNNTLNYLSSAPILLLSILFIPAIAKFSGTIFITSKPPHPIISTIVLYLIIFQCFFIIYWNRGTHAPIWTQNFIYFIFLIGWFINLAFCTHYYQAKLNNTIREVPRFARLLLLLGCLLFIFHSKQSNVRGAYYDWLSGEAAAYNQEINLRFAYLRKSNCQVCSVKDVVHRPKTIYFRQEPYISEWENNLYARYFSKQRIVISE